MKKAIKLIAVFSVLPFTILFLFSCSGNKDAGYKATLQNNPPFISQLSPDSAAIKPGKEQRLLVLAEDPDGDPLTFKWEAEAGKFNDDLDNRTLAVWTSPDEEGIFEITITASDDKGASVTEDLTIVVSNSAETNTTPEFVMFQIVDSEQGRGENWSGNPNDNTGGQLHVKITTWIVLKAVAVDPDGDILHYSWACLDGSFTTFTGKADVKSTDYDIDHDSVVWTAPGEIIEDIPVTVSIKDRYGDVSSHSISISLFIDSTTDTRDGDGDGIRDLSDNCPEISNENQANADGDDWGDACDFCPNLSTETNYDRDADGYGNGCDNCAYDANPGQEDSDGDGYGDVCEDNCDSDGDFFLKEDCGGTDCDDNAGNVYPGHIEICDGKDNDCSNGPDADEVDEDQDGYRLCEDDCDDENPNVHPNNLEIYCNDIDDDCDSGDQCGCVDGDGDGHYDIAVDCPSADDCDDNDDQRYPGLTEICDGKDNDCDGTTPSDELDGDSDGQSICEGDCDDSNPSIFLNAIENCENSVDDNCNGLVDFDDPEYCFDGILAPGDDIQTAIDFSPEGSEIILTSGTYEISETIFINKSITLRAETGDVATLQNSAMGSEDEIIRIEFASGTNEKLVNLTNITIDGDNASGGLNISALGSENKINLEKVIINNCFTTQDGAGIYAEINNENQMIINSSELFDNIAENDGGGIYLDVNDSAKTIVINSILKSNDSNNTEGGAIYLSSYSTSDQLIVNNTFSENSAYSYGGTLNLKQGHQIDSSIRLSNNIIIGSSDGGAINYEHYGSVGEILIEHNLFYDNHNLWGVYNNTPSVCSGSGYCDLCLNSDCENNDWFLASNCTYTGEGNINSSPRFSSGLNLQSNSPCVDAGIDYVWDTLSSLGIEELDNDGNNRIVHNHTSYPWNYVDMGAYELQ